MPVFDYAKSKELPGDIIEILRPLDNDRRMASDEKTFVDQLALLNDNGYIGAPVVRAALSSIVQDGNVTKDEVQTMTDPDNDYVSTPIELENDIDPTNAYTSGTDLDDFNALYTHSVNPRDSAAVQKLLSSIPNVVARHWNLEDGGMSIYRLDELAKISNRDPLVKWYAERTYVKFGPNGQGEVICDGRPVSSGPKLPGTERLSIDNPAYFLTQGDRRETCNGISLANLALQIAIGNKAIAVNDSTHGWVEAIINGKPYVVDSNMVVPREEYYENTGRVVSSPGYSADWWIGQ